jgi:hypothetical protein
MEEDNHKPSPPMKAQNSTPGASALTVLSHEEANICLDKMTINEHHNMPIATLQKQLVEANAAGVMQVAEANYKRIATRRNEFRQRKAAH